MDIKMGLSIFSGIAGLYNSVLGSVNMFCRRPTQNDRKIVEMQEEILKEIKDLRADFKKLEEKLELADLN